MTHYETVLGTAYLRHRNPHFCSRKIGQPYDTEEIDVAGGATREASFSKINPKGKVPTFHFRIFWTERFASAARKGTWPGEVSRGARLGAGLRIVVSFALSFMTTLRIPAQGAF